MDFDLTNINSSSIVILISSMIFEATYNASPSITIDEVIENLSKYVKDDRQQILTKFCIAWLKSKDEYISYEDYEKLADVYWKLQGVSDNLQEVVDRS